MQSLRTRRVLQVALTLLGATACGSEKSSTESDRGLSASAAAHLNEVVNVMQQNSLHRLTINWKNFRDSVFATATGAQTVAATYPAVRVALDILHDGHSSYHTNAGGTIFVANRFCNASQIANPTVPAGIGYVRVGSFSGTAIEATAFANAVQATIRAADRADLIGWIVDLRGNGGGNMWPMIAGLGPILGDGVLGYFLPPVGNPRMWEFRDGAARLEGAIMQSTSTPYQLLHANPRVAVLSDNLVASSGEATFIAFRGRANTRSFGGKTCGLSTANGSYLMDNGDLLVLTVALMADRAQNVFGDIIAPDEVIADNATMLQRAITWLQTP